MAADTVAIHAWFDEHGWQLEPSELRAALQERDADEDTICVLIDEGADRRRSAAAAAREQTPLLYTPAEDVLGALLLAGSLSVESSSATLDAVQATGLQAGMFERQRDRLVFDAICTVISEQRASEYKAVERELGRRHTLEQAGGSGYIRELSMLAPATTNAAHFARMVVEDARRRDHERIGLRVVEAARNGGLTPDLRAQLAQIVDQPLHAGPPPEAVDAGAFVFDEPTDPAEIRLWGDDTQIGWSAGEGLMLLGPDGVGKTTLGQQLALARAGLRATILGMTITPDQRRVLYIAADRPRQAARSLRRMVGDLDRDLLAERMTIWKGPLPAMLNEDRTLLARLAKQFDAGTVIIDSLKDVAVDIAKDEAGGRIASCFQHLIASGVELLVLHHPRKPEVGQSRPVRELTDAYGSRLIYGVMGSVIILWGQPGDTLVELRHLKQPVDELGPYTIRHDHQRGQTSIEKGSDLLDLVLSSGTQGLTALGAASLIYEKDAPTKNEIDRVRSKLDRLAEKDRILKFPGKPGGKGGGAQHSTLYIYNGPANMLV